MCSTPQAQRNAHRYASQARAAPAERNDIASMLATNAPRGEPRRNLPCLPIMVQQVDRLRPPATSPRAMADALLQRRSRRCALRARSTHGATRLVLSRGRPVPAPRRADAALQPQCGSAEPPPCGGLRRPLARRSPGRAQTADALHPSMLDLVGLPGADREVSMHVSGVAACKHRPRAPRHHGRATLRARRARPPHA